MTNTGPLIALASINRLDILRILFTSVHVPQAVHDEMIQGGETHVGLGAYRQADRLTVEAAGPLDPLLGNVLDQGEAAVIALARSLEADTVLIDERKARKIARNEVRYPYFIGIMIKLEITGARQKDRQESNYAPQENR